MIEFKRLLYNRWFLMVLILGVVLVWSVVVKLPDEYLHLVACDVGQGDAILIKWQNKQVLIDGGLGYKVVECLSRHLPFWDRKIEVVILTHAQSDHMDGLVEVFERFKVEKFVANGLENKTTSFKKFRNKVGEEGTLIHAPKRGDIIRVGPVSLEIEWPESQIGESLVWGKVGDDDLVIGDSDKEVDLNETSVVVKLVFGDFDALLVGDAGLETERALITDGVLDDVEVLKVGHHGSKYASGLDFLSEIQPELAIISVGERNRYGHPTSDTLMRLDTVGAKILRTDELGDIEIISDGKRYWVE